MYGEHYILLLNGHPVPAVRIIQQAPIHRLGPSVMVVLFASISVAEKSFPKMHISNRNFRRDHTHPINLTLTFCNDREPCDEINTPTLITC